MRVNLYEDDKWRWHWKIFKIAGQEDQVEQMLLLKSAVMSLIWKTRCPGFNDPMAAKNEGFGHMKKLGG